MNPEDLYDVKTHVEKTLHRMELTYVVDLYLIDYKGQRKSSLVHTVELPIDMDKEHANKYVIKSAMEVFKPVIEDHIKNQQRLEKFDRENPLSRDLAVMHHQISQDQARLMFERQLLKEAQKRQGSFGGLLGKLIGK